MKKKLRQFISAVMAVMLVATSFAVTPKQAYAATASFSSVGGWNESIYAQISGVSDSGVTAVSYTGPVSGSLSGDDFKYLVRDNNGGVRIDIPGLKEGTYTLTVTTTSGTLTKSGIVVNSYDRSGYAHFNYTSGVGAYNDDGTLKDNAIVLYVTDENKNTVTLSYGGVTVSGIGNILNSVGKECGEAGHEGQCKKISDGKPVYATANTNQGIIELLAKNNVPLVVRFLGTVSDSGLYKKGSWNVSTGLIDGLTAYDGNDYGGSENDNGHMARIKSGKDITLEGIGADATIDGWGFHYMAESAYPELGKSFEVRNLIFINTPEDAIGMEGVQVSSNVNSDLSASVERCWIHNNEFYCPSISNPAESDKSEGDGSVDFKRGQYFTCSYNYFEGCHKTNLVGSADTSLQFNLTYHHNYWKLCKARGPLTRNANVHMYNNVFEGQTDYAMNTRANAYILSEYNLFYMCKSPQKVESGAIKSYNDSFSSCINYMGGTIVDDKSAVVANNCQFIARGINYSKFDTDSKLSYIPTGDYQLQTSVTEARKVIESQTGVMKENPVSADEVTMSQLSYLPSSVTPVTVSALPTTLNPGKISKSLYAFTVSGTVDVTISYASDTYSATGVLVNEAGECFMTGSGTVRKLPAGTYMVQPTNFQPGDSVSLTPGVFKEFTINSIEITTNDPNAHYHNYVLTSTVEATCTAEGSKIYTCECGDEYSEPIPKTAHKFGEWVVETEATETTEGSKYHVCTVCGYKETEKIPVIGEEPDVPVGGDYTQNFTESGLTSDFYTISGNLAKNKGTVEYGGLTLTQCLKMESSTSITFTAPSKGELVLVFGGSTAASGKSVKVNGTKYTCGTDGIVTVEVSQGEVTVTKGDSINLFYMSYTAESSGEQPEADADYSAVNAAIAKIPADLSVYTDESAAAVTAAKEAVVTGKKASEQAEVDAMAKAIEDAVSALELKPVVPKKNGIYKNQEDGNFYYYVEDVVDTSKTGLVCNNDEWWYVVSGMVATSYTGFVENGAGNWYVVGGKIDITFTGLGKDNDEAGNEIWRCVINGKEYPNYTGLIQNAGYFWYVKDGIVDTSYTGFYENEHGKWYVVTGKIDTGFTGLGRDGDKWLCVQAGKYNGSYTGLVQNAGSFWYVENGELNTGFSGIVETGGSRWLVGTGKLNSTYTGTYTDATGTYTIVNGKVAE